MPYSGRRTRCSGLAVQSWLSLRVENLLEVDETTETAGTDLIDAAPGTTR